MTLDPIATHGGAAGLGAAVLYAFIKLGPMLMARLGKTNGNGKGYFGADAELKMQAVVERVASAAVAPLVQSANRMEAAMTRMEAQVNNMNASISAMVAAEQARTLSRLGPHGD